MYERDVNGEVHYSIKLNYRPCISCEREHSDCHLTDGLCPQCRAEELEDYRRQEYERDAPRRSILIRQMYRDTAAGLRLQAQALSPKAARLLLEEANRLEAIVAAWPAEKGGAT